MTAWNTEATHQNHLDEINKTGAQNRDLENLRYKNEENLEHLRHKNAVDEIEKNKELEKLRHKNVTKENAKNGWW